MVNFLVLFASLSGCVRNQALPYVGECAEYPDGVYEFGQIGIGTCLAGPADLTFTETADGEPVLVVTNSNPYVIFDGGSLLTIPWSTIDLGSGKNVIDQMDPGQVDLPAYAGAVQMVDSLALVGVRLSEDARTRTADDAIWLVDLSDPTAPNLASRGDDGGHTIEVEADPIDIAYDDQTGFAYVANRTAHTISVLDTTQDPIAVVPPWPEYALTEATFSDVDGSGSRATLADLEVDDSTLLADEEWNLSWVEGSWYLWLPHDGALERTTHNGADSYVPSALGAELDPDDWKGVSGFAGAYYAIGSPGVLYFHDQGAIFAATSGSAVGDWSVSTSPILAPDEKGESYGTPSVLSNEEIFYLFHDTIDADGVSTIELATADDGGAYLPEEKSTLFPELEHEVGGIADPFVFQDVEEERYRMFYTAFDGTSYTIAEATSEDLLTWTKIPTPVFAVDGVDVAAPVIAPNVGLYRMWYSRHEADGWSVGLATSPDGIVWTDEGEVLEIEGEDDAASTLDAVPRVALAASSLDAFRLTGANIGTVTVQVSPGGDFDAASYGWSGTALAGFQLDAGEVGTDSEGGIQLDSIDRARGLAWLTLVDRNGNPSIGVADVEDDGALVPLADPVLVASDGGFDEDGVHTGVVVELDGVYHLYYAGDDGAVTTIGLATSTDGLTWSKQGQVLDVGEEWDSASVVPGSIEQRADGSLRLWYTGSDGEERRIGTATSVDGQSFEREEGDDPWILAGGAPGEWDDSGVSDPWFLVDDSSLGGDGLEHLFYSGYDGDLWRIGHATRAVGESEWLRTQDTTSEEYRAIVSPSGGLFHADGLMRPVVEREADGWTVWFAGIDNDVTRVGKAHGRDADFVHKTPRRPTLGDTLAFETQKGDEDTLSISLDAQVDEAILDGIGLTSITLDQERGILFAASKERSYVFAVDIRDDSAPAETDLNYLDIEAVVGLSTASGGTGFREILPIVGSDFALALNDSPEAVLLMDLAEIADDDYSEILYDEVVGWLPAARGLERDQGTQNRSTVGPGQLALHPDGRRLFVTNFNGNSISVYDLSLGPYGQLVKEVGLVGEAPYAIELTPDGNHAVFANYVGGTEGELASSTLGVLDVLETSPTYLEVVTWIENQ